MMDVLPQDDDIDLDLLYPVQLPKASFREKLKRQFQTWLWLFPIAFIVFFFVDMGRDVFYDDKSLHLYILLVDLIALIAVLTPFFLLLFNKRLQHWLVVLVIGVMGFYSLDIRQTIFYWLFDLDIILHPAKFSQCVDQTKQFDETHSMGVCNNKLEGIGAELGTITTAIIYDSSDEITKPVSQRSSAWKKTALSFVKQVPFGEYGYEATHLIDHYYYVFFSTDLIRDFRAEEYAGGRLKN